jgi:hypothetical protein
MSSPYIVAAYPTFGRTKGVGPILLLEIAILSGQAILIAIRRRRAILIAIRHGRAILLLSFTIQFYP